jgi:hypothetical protein
VSAVVLGYLVADDGRQAVGRFQSLPAPTRVWMTSSRNALVTGTVRHLPLLGRAGVPTSGVRALLLQVDLIDPSAAGWLAVGGHGDALTHALDYLPGNRTRGLVVVRPGSRAWVDLVLHGGRAGAAVEILGWWAG